MFTDPIAQVIITNKETQWQWTAPDFPFLTGVVILYEMERMASVQISIDVPYDDAIKYVFTSPGPFTVNNYVQARIGYASGGWTPWAVGILHGGGDGLSIDANGCTGTVTFQGLAKNAFYTVDKKLPDSEEAQLEFVADSMGLDLVLGQNARERLEDDWVFNVGLKSMSSWEILKGICTRDNLIWLIGPDPSGDGGTSRKLFVLTEKELKTLQDVSLRRTYAIRGVVDVANNQYPCASWSPDAGTATWVAELPDPASHGQYAGYIDEDTGEVKTVTVSASDQEETTFGSLQNIDPFTTNVDTLLGELVVDKAKTDEEPGEYVPVVAQPGEAGEKSVKTKLGQKRVAGNNAQKGSITCPVGLPEEAAGTTCYLKGAGKIYDDLYQVRSLTHSYAIGSWEMTLGVWRWGSFDPANEEKKEGKGGQLS
jgi:hypothetical protein